MVENVHIELENTMNWSTPHMNALKVVRMKDKETLYILYQVVDKSGFEKITSAKSSKEVWDILEKEYKGVTE
ncbi:hypothetical protein VIGAN_11171800 [Vigna angularis var. angularis]|uniref:Uncharacterized protein n=1 Tax=Vigna angularis var. angularis TaxID=157739 RepID=A0A0S3TAK7_PHAAN|nr:hypothetical protein VIGAN_11171800 [Vigna angularis var. angularis]